MNERLRKVERLRKREEIRSVLRQRGLEGKFCFLHIRAQSGSYSRLGLVVSRAVGKAVFRNKTKRRLREIFRRAKSQFCQSIDLVIRAKSEIRVATYRELRDEICLLLRRTSFM